MGDARRLREDEANRLDIAAGVVLASVAAIIVAGSGLLRSAPLGSLCVVAFCALVAWRARSPIAVALVAAALLVAMQLSSHASDLDQSAAGVPALGALFLYAYALGARRRWQRSLPVLLLLCVAANATAAGFNPLIDVLAIGPWIGGALVRSRTVAEAQLAARARELEEEREQFAVQSVRYERGRIARELHDIVAHNVSLIVVQASAGEYLTSADPGAAGEAFESIGEAARQAEIEIERLIELLGSPAADGRSPGLRIIDDLVRRARASGLVITCQLAGDCDELSATTADTAYRFVQESVTNATKHAPGALVSILIRGLPDTVEVQIANGPSQAANTGLEHVGGGHGLTGIQERISGCGGLFTGGPTPDGGWCNTARLPRGEPRPQATTHEPRPARGAVVVQGARN